MRYLVPSLSVALSCTLWTACDDVAPSGPSGQLAIEVAALDLPGITDVCYSLSVANDANQTVWQKSNICGSSFGVGGNISYVGTCDATDSNGGGATHTVTLTIDGVYSNGTSTTGTAVSDFINPCAAPHNPSGCQQQVDCLENQDTPIVFNLTFMRQANQGFFDVAVNFQDIFCSAKVDCQNASGQPLKLLFNPATGQRDTTIVTALACTAGPGSSSLTSLYRNPLVITCDNGQTILPVDVPKGNAYTADAADPNLTDAIWQYATYQDTEDLSCAGTSCNKVFWNIAIGLDATFDNCRLTTQMTAADPVTFDGLATPSATSYPYIDVDLQLTNATGLTCSTHPINGSPAGVSTTYTPNALQVFFDTAYAPDVNECLLDPDICGTDADCVDTPTSYICEPDMVMLGQYSWFDNVSNSNYPINPLGLTNPIDLVKVGNRYYVSEFSGARILIFEGAINHPSSAIGQADLSTRINWPTASASNLSGPQGLATDGTRLIVADRKNHRVLIWNQAPKNNLTPADIVLGQASFSGKLANQGLAAPTAATMNYPTYLSVIAGKLFVSDSSNNRILVWNAIPTQSGAPADLVLGQPDFTSNAINRTGVATSCNNISLYYPYSLETDGTRLLVSDYLNHRILVWNSIPTALNTPPSVVIGQPDFVTCTAGATASLSSSPRAQVLSSDGGLYFADSNNRILYYASVPTTNGAAATSVIGQANFTDSAINRGQANPVANGFRGILSMRVDGDSLLVVEYTNNRILRYAPLPRPATEAEGAALSASSVWGQPDFTSNLANRAPSIHQYGFNWIGGLCANSEYVVVVERDNDRALVFRRDNLKGGAVSVIGQPDFNTNGPNAGTGVPSQRSLDIANTHGGCAFDSRNRLYIADNFNNRIMIWNSVPTTNFAPADVVLGQPNFTSKTWTTCTQTSINSPWRITIVNDKLIVPEYGAGRVSILDVSTEVIDKNIDVVIGANDFTTCTNGTYAANRMYRCYGAYSDGTRLFVGDGGNRILVFNSIPTSNGASADFVVGQSSFSGTEVGLSATRFSGIQGQGAVINGIVWMPDLSNNRIVGFNLSKFSPGQPQTNIAANYVIGQPDLVSKVTQNLGNATNSAFSGFSQVTAIVNSATPDGMLWIDDYRRVIGIKASKILEHATYVPDPAP